MQVQAILSRISFTMNTKALYEHAMDHLRATAPDPAAMLREWRGERPDRLSDRDLLREYAWVVACCGLTPQVIRKRWDALGEAFCQWDPARIGAQPAAVRIAALGVIRNVRKIDAICALAADLARAPGLMASLAPLAPKEALARVATLPYVGATNKYHLLRNLGWDVVVRTGPVTRLAAYLALSAEALCGQIAAQTGERIRTVDLVLWYWGHQVGDRAMKEIASLFRLM